MSEGIRNIAIIAHVDHGKTSLVDQLLKQSGTFREGEVVEDCVMDSNPLERERGITILAKNCAITYTDRNSDQYHINILDTPGHADFGGEVERVLKMADGALLIVDAFEGPMPQTRFVLSKALSHGLQPIVVINKMDRPEARPQEVINEIFDLLVDLGAEDHALDFPVIYACAKEGWANTEPTASEDVHALFDTIISNVPAPQLDADAPLQMMITTLDYNDYVGRIGIGRVYAGSISTGQRVMSIDRDGNQKPMRIQQLYQFKGLGREEVDTIQVGDICAVVGLDKVDIGDTLADIENPVALDPVAIDEPTLHMLFRVNDGPFVGQEGKLVTSRQIRDRLDRELQSNVALRVAPGQGGEDNIVSGRGLMHLGILLENMRREGYELTVGKPQVIFREVDGVKQEPYELLVVDVPGESMGPVMQLIGERRGDTITVDAKGDYTHLEFRIAARGLIGLRTRLLNATGGDAIIHHSFLEYGDFLGEMPGRNNGVMIATETGQVTAYALEGLADRGVMFVQPGEQVYAGQVVGEHNKDKDITVNVTRKKALTNMRSANKEMTTTLKAHRPMTLEMALEYIEEDEYLELTPESVRMRKRMLRESDRRREDRKVKQATANA